MRDNLKRVTVDEALIVTGKVDGAGRLVAADPRLLALQQGAGGRLGDVLVVPALASLVRLARTLRVLVSRGVIAAEGDRDLDLWVRAQPDGEMIDLSISGWDERPRPHVDAALAAEREQDFAALESEGEWACDAALMIGSLDPELSGLADGPLPTKLSRLFRLEENDDGDLPLLDGVAKRAAFADQRATMRAAPGVRLVLHGLPLFDEHDGFCGLSGGYRILDRSTLSPRASPPAPDPAFARQIDTALRQPLGRIIANADQISAREDGPLRQDYAGYATDISAAGRHLLGLVDDLSDLQAADRLDFRIDAETVDLVDIARRAAGLLAVRAQDKGVRIDPPAADELLSARGDFRRVLQILVNLIGNAVRYSPEGAPVWVRSEEEGDLAAIVVCDQGKGIAIADQARIFDKFERLDPSEANGSGLGLFISRQLARAMGGDITVDSAPGMGARFVLTLPRD